MTCSLCPNPAVPLYPDANARPLCEQCRASEAAKYQADPKPDASCSGRAVSVLSDLLRLFQRELSSGYSTAEQQQVLREARELVGR